MNGIKYLKEQGIQDRIINPEDLPEYQMKLSGMLEHFHYLMDKSKLPQPAVISSVCDMCNGDGWVFVNSITKERESCCKCSKQTYL